jgi:hypothetical protein
LAFLSAQSISSFGPFYHAVKLIRGHHPAVNGFIRMMQIFFYPKGPPFVNEYLGDPDILEGVHGCGALIRLVSATVSVKG